LSAAKGNDQVGVKAAVVSLRRAEVTGERELVLVLAAYLELLGRDLGVFAHREAGAWLTDAGKNGLEMSGPQSQPRQQLVLHRFAAMALHQDGTILIRVDHRSVADRVGAAGHSCFDLAQCDLVADEDTGLQAGAAGTLQVNPRRLEREAGADDALARQVPVPGVFDHRTQRYVAEHLSLQVEFLDNGRQCRRHHVLVGTAGIVGVCAAERNTQTSNDGDLYRPAIVPHRSLRVLVQPGTTLLYA